MSAVAHLHFDKKEILVSAKLYFYGSNATEEVAQKIVNEISEQYNAVNGKIRIENDIFEVKFGINFEVIDTLEDNIYVYKIETISKKISF